MRVPITWRNQDPLQLTEGEWLSLLQDSSIVNEAGRKMLAFVYSQPNHQSSATEIGEALGGVSQQQVTAWNRRIAKQVYKRLDKEPPLNMKGGYRFWNALLDGEAEGELNGSASDVEEIDKAKKRITNGEYATFDEVFGDLDV